MPEIVYWEGEPVDLDALDRQRRRRPSRVEDQIEAIMRDLSPEEVATLTEELNRRALLNAVFATMH